MLPAAAATYNVFPAVVGNTLSTWPATWQTLPGLQSSAVNSGLSGNLSRLDFVGNATYPTAYYACDANYVYFRIRINSADPAYPNSAWTHTIQLLIDNNGDKLPEHAFSWDTKGTGTDHQLELNVPDPASPNTTSSRWNSVNMIDRDGNSGTKLAPDFNMISGHTNDGYVRIVGGQTGPAGANTTAFVDFAVKWSYLTGTYNSAAISSLAPGQTWRVQFASINDGTDHANINADVAGSATLTTTLGTTGAWSDLITPTTSVSVSSSSPTNGYRDSVSFTATLPADATGNVTFKTNNVALSMSNLVSGIAYSLAISNLPRGTNLITAEYAGDGNYSGSTNSLNQIVTNHPPSAGVITVYRTAGLRYNFRWSDLGTNWNDVDGDAISHSLANLLSTNGVTVTNFGPVLQYPATAANGNDRFYYTITDLFGGTNTVFVDVVVDPFVTGQQVAISPANPNAVTFFGRPGYSYLLQRSTNLFAGVGWVNIRTNTIGASGCTNVLDHFSDLGLPPVQAFYRVGWKPSY